MSLRSFLTKIRSADVAALSVVIIVLTYAPIPLGSKHPLGALALSTALLLCSGIWLACRAIGHSTPLPLTRSESTIAILFAIFTAYLWLSTVPLSFGIVEALNPSVATHYSMVVPTPTAISLSLDRGASLELAIRSSSLLAVFLLLTVSLTSKRRVRWFAFSLVAAGIAHAAFALLDMYSGGALFRQPIAGLSKHAGSISGTYTNRNHFAGLMEMTLSLSLAFYFTNARSFTLRDGWRAAARKLARGVLGYHPWYLLATLIPLFGLLFSASRGGALSTVLAGASAAALFFLRQSRVPPHRIILVAVLIAPLLFAATVGIDRLASRLDAHGLEDSRYELRQLGYRMFADYKLFGSGVGTFQQIYPAYEEKSFSVGKLLHHVHNDYLELLIETGIVGFSIFGAAIAVWIWNVMRVPVPSGDKAIYAICLGCFGGVTSLLIHSLVDWNLNIPSNALWFTALLSLGLASLRFCHNDISMMS